MLTVNLTRRWRASPRSSPAPPDQEAVARDVRLWERPARRTDAGGNVGAYNNFWIDRGTTTIGTRRTSLIVDPPDGRIPPLTPEAKTRRETRSAYRGEHPADSWEDRGLNDRCMFTTGLPMVPSAYNNNVHVFQTPDHVVMLIEMTHTLRVVPLDGRPHGDIRQFAGDSRGHWEGDTLVVETMHFNRLTGVRGSTPNARLVERFTRICHRTVTETSSVAVARGVVGVDQPVAQSPHQGFGAR